MTDLAKQLEEAAQKLNAAINGDRTGVIGLELINEEGQRAVYVDLREIASVLDQARARLAERQSVPEGWVCVPEEVYAAICEAAVNQGAEARPNVTPSGRPADWRDEESRG